MLILICFQNIPVSILPVEPGPSKSISGDKNRRDKELDKLKTKILLKIKKN